MLFVLLLNGLWAVMKTDSLLMCGGIQPTLSYFYGCFFHRSSGVIQKAPDFTDNCQYVVYTGLSLKKFGKQHLLQNVMARILANEHMSKQVEHFTLTSTSTASDLLLELVLVLILANSGPRHLKDFLCPGAEMVQWCPAGSQVITIGSHIQTWPSAHGISYLFKYGFAIKSLFKKAFDI